MSSKPPKAGGANLRLKIVVRRLPADLPEHVFWKSATPWITRESDDNEGQEGAERVVWSSYRAGKVRRRYVPGPRREERVELTRQRSGSGKDKDDVHSRAYISFKTADGLVAFHRAYDGWSFRDKQGELGRFPQRVVTSDPLAGNVSQAVVEFASYQRIPTAPIKLDARQGTIEEGALRILRAERELTFPRRKTPTTQRS